MLCSWSGEVGMGFVGFSHTGFPDNGLRPIERRDMVAMSIRLTGLRPYLSDQLDAEVVYRGN